MTSSVKKNGYGQSHAKIILIGEHSVVYSKPAIALPLSAVKTTIKILPAASGIQTIDCRYFSGPLKMMPPIMKGLQHLIFYILKKLQQENAGLQIKVTSQLPEERGMGSSAAAAVAMARALYDFFDQPLDHQLLLNLANIEEVDTHGNPSGLDAATSASSVPVWMIKGKELVKLPIKLDACLLICDSGIKGRTKEAVAAVKERLQKFPQQTQTLLDSLGKLTFLARQQLAQNDPRGLGKTFTQAQDDLKKLGVSSPLLDQLIKKSLTLGSLGSKLTGGGRGGCFICLMPNTLTAQKAAESLKTAGATATWIQPLTANQADQGGNFGDYSAS